MAGEYSRDNHDSASEPVAIFTGGFRDNIDIVLWVPYQFLRFRDGEGNRTTVEGVSDVGIEMKGRFYAKRGLSFALKPGLTFPTGDDEKVLGDGKASYSLMFILTKETSPIFFHMNLGFTKNRNELKDVWHYSLTTEYSLAKMVIELTQQNQIGLDDFCHRTKYVVVELARHFLQSKLCHYNCL